MDRKTFEYKSNKTGAGYVFAERNRADVSFTKAQNKLRAERVKFIQENIKNEQHQSTLLAIEMNKVYNFAELEQYLGDNLDETKLACYDSFKINNDKIPFGEFVKLFEDDEFYEIRNLIVELEYSNYFNDDEVRAALGMSEKQFDKFKNGQPALYAYAKKHIKKKLEK